MSLGLIYFNFIKIPTIFYFNEYFKYNLYK